MSMSPISEVSGLPGIVGANPAIDILCSYSSEVERGPAEPLVPGSIPGASFFVSNSKNSSLIYIYIKTT